MTVVGCSQLVRSQQSYRPERSLGLDRLGPHHTLVRSLVGKNIDLADRTAWLTTAPLLPRSCVALGETNEPIASVAGSRLSCPVCRACVFWTVANCSGSFYTLCGSLSTNAEKHIGAGHPAGLLLASRS